VQGLRFSPFQFRLALLGSFCGIRSWYQIGFFREVAPAFVSICGPLRIRKLLQF